MRKAYFILMLLATIIGSCHEKRLVKKFYSKGILPSKEKKVCLCNPKNENILKAIL